MENEELKKIGYGEHYFVSNTGNVYSFRGGTKRKISPIKTGRGGYEKVRLYNGGRHKYKDLFVHRLVASAFVENPDNLPVVNHKDENPSNNRADNLEWCTVSYNNSYGSAIRKKSETMKKRFSENPSWRERVSKNLTGRNMKEETKEKIRKANNKPVVCIKDGVVIAEYESAKIAEEKTGIKRSNIRKVINGERNHAGGFKWKYAACGGEIEGKDNDPSIDRH